MPSLFNLTLHSSFDQMLATLFEWLAWFQPPASGGGDGGSTMAAAEGGGDVLGASGGCATQGGMLILMMAVFYFLLIRPQQKRAKEHDSLLKSLTKGTVVRTTGGIRGEVFELKENEATLLIAPKTKINVLRANIAGVVSGEATPPKGKSDKETKSDKDPKPEKDTKAAKDKDTESSKGKSGRSAEAS